MYRLLIVDDERRVREGLLSHIDWASLGIQPCVCIKDTLENYEKSVHLGCRMFTSNDPETAARLLRELGVRDI